MTEMSPLGTASVLHEHQMDLPKDEIYKLRAKQGRTIYGVEMKIVDDDGNDLPWDGEAFGALRVRGPWICSDYYKLDGAADAHFDGWFDTGDVAGCSVSCRCLSHIAATRAKPSAHPGTT